MENVATEPPFQPGPPPPPDALEMSRKLVATWARAYEDSGQLQAFNDLMMETLGRALGTEDVPGIKERAVWLGSLIRSLCGYPLEAVSMSDGTLTKETVIQIVLQLTREKVQETS